MRLLPSVICGTLGEAQYTPPTRLNSTAESRRRRQCVLDLSDSIRSVSDWFARVLPFQWTLVLDKEVLDKCGSLYGLVWLSGLNGFAK